MIPAVILCLTLLISLSAPSLAVSKRVRLAAIANLRQLRGNHFEREMEETVVDDAASTNETTEEESDNSTIEMPDDIARRRMMRPWFSFLNKFLKLF